ncbi:recombinase family protein [Rubellimicrobium arenae]|uniref:recombinase family protein n=1 Tax=Rubellimicrobium arenae TaxID=2817372 RepID=UPI001B30B5E7|nr:recombinase family protein [Rubellimicrobium arenae]
MRTTRTSTASKTNAAPASGPAPVTKPLVRKLRCAVYTRKSSEEGLEQEFNSLHAQREACEAYIASQRSEGWVLVRDQYDDGGISGGTLERPALQRLLSDIEDGLVDVVVVYKIDRLSRSLMDFSKLVEVFDRNGVTFVSVTQSFNTTTSMGRLTLNILLSFAQFEREVTAERIRDKVRASRMKGIWMGGVPPLGYRVESRKLVADPERAPHVRWIFERFAEVGSGTVLTRELRARGVTTRSGGPISKSVLYRLLSNRTYLGEAVYKGTSYPGEHEGIVDRALWDKVHAILQDSPRLRANRTRAQTPALLKGLIFGPDRAAFSPSHTRKGGRLYRYYVSQTVLKQGTGSCPVGRVPAGEIEAAVVDQLRAVFRQPEIVVGTWRAAHKEDAAITEAESREALHQLDPLWDELFPAEQARIVQLLVERIDLTPEGLNLALRVDGLTGLVQEMAIGLEQAA